MQYTIRKLYSTERKDTQRSVRIERIVKPSSPLTIIKQQFFREFRMRYNIRSVNSTLRSVRALNHPYGSNRSLSLLSSSLSSNNKFFREFLMRCNIPSVNCTLRSARTLNDPYGSNGSLNLLAPSLSSNNKF